MLKADCPDIPSFDISREDPAAIESSTFVIPFVLGAKRRLFALDEKPRSSDVSLLRPKLTGASLGFEDAHISPAISATALDLSFADNPRDSLLDALLIDVPLALLSALNLLMSEEAMLEASSLLDDPFVNDDAAVLIADEEPPDITDPAELATDPELATDEACAVAGFVEMLSSFFLLLFLLNILLKSSINLGRLHFIVEIILCKLM